MLKTTASLVIATAAAILEASRCGSQRAPRSVAPAARAVPPAPAATTTDSSAPLASDREATHATALVKMRDGSFLATEVWRSASDGRRPVILERLPYGRLCCRSAEIARYFGGAGYTLVTQDVRGRGDSEGHFGGWFQEREDGYDTIEWIAGQSWSNGRVGMLGGSYLGTAQWMAAAARPPHLACIAPIASGTDPFRGVPYRGGALNLSSALGFSASMARGPHDPWPSFNEAAAEHVRPLVNADSVVGKRLELFREWVAHPMIDAYWQRMIWKRADFERADLPVLYVTGWYDGEISSLLQMWRGMRDFSPAAAEQFMVMGPWTHENTFFGKAEDIGNLRFPAYASRDVWAIHRAFFDRFLKQDASAKRLPTVEVYVTGAEEWREMNDFPPPNAVPRSLYLRAADTMPPRTQRLSWEVPTSDEARDSFTFDPSSPDPLSLHSGELESRDLANRSDVLVYESAPFSSPMELIGAVRLELFGASDGPDTDWVVNLFDLDESARARKLGVRPGILRARYWEGFDHEALLLPGHPEHFVIEVAEVAHRVLAGHRLRLEISSSAAPIYDLNPNTGRPVATEVETRPARNSVFHDHTRPSRLVLPVVIANAQSGAPGQSSIVKARANEAASVFPITQPSRSAGRQSVQKRTGGE